MANAGLRFAVDESARHSNTGKMAEVWPLTPKTSAAFAAKLSRWIYRP